MGIILILIVCICSAIAFAGPIEQNVNSNFERIVTDIKDVKRGVPIDYRYNESDIAEGGYSSAPGCPKSELGYPWVYYNDMDTPIPNKCYLAGQRGPCRKHQKLFVERGNPVGFCNCDCFEDVQLDLSKSSQVQFCWMALPPSGPEVAFFPGSRTCYQLFKQGPCNEKEWLVKANNKSNESSSSLSANFDLGELVKCEERRCPVGSTPVLDDLGEGNSGTGACKFHSTFKFSHTLTTNLGDNCPENMKYSSLLKKCLKKFTFVQ